MFVIESREAGKNIGKDHEEFRQAITGAQSQISETQEANDMMASALQKLIDYETNGRGPR